MHTFVSRILTNKTIKKLAANPAVALIGPRQCGKSTLARVIIKERPDSIYLDLEKPSDLNRLRDPELFFKHNAGSLIILDEIQRQPDLFPVLRSTIDERDRHGQFLILGSASPDLIRQSSESLAGRIAYLELTPFLFDEINSPEISANPLHTLWLRGGYPRGFLTADDHQSFEWRLDFIRTFLEQDISNLGIQIPAENLSRFWRMFAHVNGQVLNYAKLADSLGVSGHTVRHYIDLLRHTFMLRRLEPFTTNTKKRLVKSPKVYIRDAGLLHALLDIESFNDLLAHPGFGASWEGFVVEQILSTFPRLNACFYRNSNGNEIDLILEHKQKRIAVECKASSSPRVRPGLSFALADTEVTETWVVAPVSSSYPLSKNITVAPLGEFLNYLWKIVGK